MTEDLKPCSSVEDTGQEPAPSPEADTLDRCGAAAVPTSTTHTEPSQRTGWAALQHLLCLLSRELTEERRRSDSVCRPCARLLSSLLCLCARTKHVTQVLAGRLEAGLVPAAAEVEQLLPPLTVAEQVQSLPETLLTEPALLGLDSSSCARDEVSPVDSYGFNINSATSQFTASASERQTAPSSETLQEEAEVRPSSDQLPEIQQDRQECCETDDDIEQTSRGCDETEDPSEALPPLPATISIEICREYVSTTSANDFSASSSPVTPRQHDSEPPESSPTQLEREATGDEGDVGTRLPPADPSPTYVRTDTTTQCSVCQHMFAERAECRQHMRISHGAKKVYLCALCPLAYLARNALYGHEAAVHAAGPLLPHVCGRCLQAFATARLLRAHRDEAHGQPVACQHCRRTFRRQELWQAHQAVHQHRRPFRCSRCGKSFTKRLVWQKHQATHQRRPRQHQCTECQRGFVSAETLQAHQRRHRSPMLQCDQCARRFSTEARLAAHREAHCGGRRYVCPVCQRAFTKKSLLADHSRTHTGERPFICELCGAGFAQRSNLSAHKNSVHLNQRPFKCEACQKSFKRKQMLKNHQRAVHPENGLEDGDATAESMERLRGNQQRRPFRCGVCQRAFKHRQRRDAHAATHTDSGGAQSQVGDTGDLPRQQHIAERDSPDTGQCPPDDSPRDRSASLIDGELVVDAEDVDDPATYQQA